MTDPADQDTDVGTGSSARLRPAGRPELSVRTTHQLEDLERLVENSFRVAFPHRIWVAGLVAESDTGGDGSLDFLLSSGPDGPLSLDGAITAEQRRELTALLDRDFDADIEDLLARGRWLRAGGLLRYSFAEQRLDFSVSALDPGPTEAALAAERDEVRRRVRADGLPERQRSLPAPTAPLRIAVVAPRGSDTGDQVVDRLRASGYALRLRLLPVDLHDRDVVAHLAATLTGAAVDTDLVLLVRRNGRPLGLAPYDAEAVARAIARSPVPVVTGLGGPEAAVADDVAAACAPTAAAAADLVIARLDAAAERLHSGATGVALAAGGALDRAAGRLTEAYDRVGTAGAAAARRADAADARRRRWLFGAATACAVLVVAVAIATRTPVVLAALVLLVVAVAALQRQRTRFRSRGGTAVRVSEPGFAAVLERLDRIREELATSSSPERVHELRQEADELLHRGEQILGRRTDQPGRAAGGPGGSPQPAAPGRPPAPAAERAASAAAADRAAAAAGVDDAATAAGTDRAATRRLPTSGPADGEQTAVLRS